MTRPPLLATGLAIAAAGALTLPALAAADSFAYRDDRDVRIVDAADDRGEWVIAGDDQAYATLPTADDAGNVSAIIRRNDSWVPKLRWVGANGRDVVDNMLPEQGSSGLNTGPLSVRVDPTGKLLAYTYLKYTGIGSTPIPHLAIVDPTAPGLPSAPAIDQAGYSFASWFDGRLVVSDGATLSAERSAAQRLQFTPWPIAEVTSADVARDGRRALLGNGRRFLIAELDGGGPPDATAGASCLLPDDGSDLYRGGAPSAALSPDGRHVALAGRSGLQVARIGSFSGDGGACPLENVRLVSAKGGLPTASAYTVPVPSAPDPGQPPSGPAGPAGPGPGTTPGTPTAPGGRTPAKRAELTLARPVRKGQRVTVRLTCARRCSYVVRLQRGKRTLRTVRGTAKPGVPRRLTVGGARGKGLTVSVTALGQTVKRRLPQR